MSPKKKSKAFLIDNENALQKIEQVLSQIKSTDVSDFRAMNRPSEGALMTVKATLMLLGHSESDATWDKAKKLMVNSK